MGLLVCAFGLRSVAVKKPYLTNGTNRVAEIVAWQLLLTFVGAMILGMNEGEGGGGVDAFLLAVQVGGGVLAVFGALFEGAATRHENVEIGRAHV